MATMTTAPSEVDRMLLTRPSDTDPRRFHTIVCVTVEILSVKRKYFFSLTFCQRVYHFLFFFQFQGQSDDVSTFKWSMISKKIFLEIVQFVIRYKLNQIKQ